MSKTFYMTPGSCSTGIHILLEECGLVFAAQIVDLLAGEQYSPEFLAINPKGTIPVLVLDDGSALAEFCEIAWWLARSDPLRHLLPGSTEGEVRVLGIMNYVVSTLHGQGFARIFTSERFAPDGADQESVRARGREIVDQGLLIVDRELEGRDHVVEQFGIADAALFYVEFWAERTGIPLPAHCAAHFRRLLGRPAVRQVLAEEGYGSLLRQYPVPTAMMKP